MRTRISKTFKRPNESGIGDEGSALIELALSLPLLCFILLAAAEFARVAYASVEVTNAAHSAAIYASTGQAQLADSGGITNAAQADSQVSCGGSAVSVTSVTTACTCADTTYVPASCSDNQTCINNNTGMVTAVTVTTSCSFNPLLSSKVPGIGGFTGPFTLQGKSTQVVSNQ
jgi:Flp pilus assembly protein TadG